MEVCCGEYGDYTDRMLETYDYERNFLLKEKEDEEEEEEEAETPDLTTTRSLEFYNHTGSSWLEFRLLIMKMWLQMWRDKNYLLLKSVIYILIGLLVGVSYLNMGKDASKLIYIFGLYYICCIMFLYVPMLPTLLYCEYALHFIVNMLTLLHCEYA